jgi:hypothetical protein
LAQTTPEIAILKLRKQFPPNARHARAFSFAYMSKLRVPHSERASPSDSLPRAKSRGWAASRPLHAPPLAPPSDPKRRGEWAELLFLQRASEHGLCVSKPWGDSARYDFIVEHAARFHRVQVKCASWGPPQPSGRRSYRCHVTSRRFDWQTRNFGYRAYSTSEIEFFAIYVVPEQTWFIVPVRRSQMSMLLSPHDPKSKYFPFCEAWHLLK